MGRIMIGGQGERGGILDPEGGTEVRVPSDQDLPSPEAVDRSRFLASMGHTLRSPLNSILGFAEVLLYGSSDPLTDRQRGHVLRMVEAGERQLEIIDNLIELARMHSGDVSLEPAILDPRGAVRDTMEEYKPKAKAVGAELVFDPGTEVGRVHVDPASLRRALGNLVSNAIRHVGEGGQVHLSLTQEDCPEAVGRRGRGAVRIGVTDDGPGIDPERASHLFEDLGSGEAELKRRQQRCGTGLPLARRLIEAHGGRVWLEHSGEGGRGSCFFVSLPLAEEGEFDPGSLDTGLADKGGEGTS